MLRPAIGVANQPCRRPASRNSAKHGVRDQMFRHPFAYRVTGDFTAVRVSRAGRTQPNPHRSRSPQTLGPKTFADSPVDREHFRFLGEVPATFFRATCACATHGGHSPVRPALGTLAARGSLVVFVQSAPHLDSFAKYVANLSRRSRSVPTSTSYRLTCASSTSLSVSGFRCRSTTSFSLPAFVAPRPRFASTLIRPHPLLPPFRHASRGKDPQGFSR